MSSSKKTTALRYASFGKPADVLQLEERELPPLGAGEALLKVLAAPINPADFGRIAGTYGSLASLPATAGLEGIAEIVELADSTTRRRVGERVFVPSSIGSWQTYAVATAAELFPAPEKLSLHEAAMGWVNPPTAWKLLHDFRQLQAGDWIVQNAATSAVGKLVVQFAVHLGLKTINLVRDPSSPSAKRLEALGADVVLRDDKDAAKAALEATQGQKAKLALNSVGGSSAYTLCKLLDDRSPLVTFGGMDRDPAPFPTRFLIFNDISLRGFWVSRWYAEAQREEIIDLHNEVFTFMETSKTEIDVAATFSLAQHREAFAAANAPGKEGKVLFEMDS